MIVFINFEIDMFTCSQAFIISASIPRLFITENDDRTHVNSSM